MAKKHKKHSNRMAQAENSASTADSKSSAKIGKTTKSIDSVKTVQIDALNEAIKEVEQATAALSKQSKKPAGTAKAKSKAASAKKPWRTMNDVKRPETHGKTLSDKNKVEVKPDKKAANIQTGAKSDDGSKKNSCNKASTKKPSAGEASERSRKKFVLPAFFRVLLSGALILGATIVLTPILLERADIFSSSASTEMKEIYEAGGSFIDAKPNLALFNYFVIFGVLAVLAAALWRPCTAIAIVFSLIIALTYANNNKYETRSAPLLPEDIALSDQVGNMTNFVDMGEILRMVFGIILVVGGAIALDYYLHKILGRDTKRLPWWQRFVIVPRVTFTLAGVAYLVVVAGPFYRQTSPKWLKDEVKWVAWNQTENYANHGFLAGFIYNLGKFEAEEPENYNEETMRQIAKKYSDLQAADKTDRKKLGQIADNIVIIMNESFYDPALLTEYYSHVGGDVTPNLHALFQKYPSGYMFSPEYGGGTANVEFEAQTELTNFWAKNCPYVNSLSKAKDVLGIASWAKQNGNFTTTAIHSYDGTMYKRDLVYPVIGYDEFIDVSEMKYQEHEYSSPYVNDQSIYKEALDTLRDNDGPTLVNVVTMQNHMPYDSAGYPELQFGLIGTENYLLESSMQTLSASDRYLGEFISELDELDEKTVVLWFGDHAAGVLDAYKNSDLMSEKYLAHLTPYFIYTNFDVKNTWTEEKVAEQQKQAGIVLPKGSAKSVDLPTTTPNCMQNTLYDLLGAKKPARAYLLDQLCRETPILSLEYFGAEAPKQTDALQDYKLTNYDILNGRRYWSGV